MVKAVLQTVNDRKAKEREAGVWDVLKSLASGYEMTADGIFSQFKWQVSGPLFDDVSEVEEVLRSMLKDGIVDYDPPNKSWRIRASRSGRFPAPW